jgi:hypothetical protein
VAVNSSATTPRVAAGSGVAASNVSAIAVNIFRMTIPLFSVSLPVWSYLLPEILTLFLTKVNPKMSLGRRKKKHPEERFRPDGCG